MSLLNLAYIFILSDKDISIPSFSGEEKKPSNLEASKASISFSEKALYYNGEGKLDLMEDVTALDADGSDAKDKVFIAIKTGSNLNEKIVRYSLRDNSGSMCYATRSLYLEDYEGPTISVTAIALNSQEDLDDLLSILIEQKSIQAYDGYGNDITTAISYDYSAEGSSGGYRVTFTVINGFNDAYSCTEVFQVLKDGPTLTLIGNSVTVPLGQAFNARDFIADAMDPLEGDLRVKVIISGNVNTGAVGTYYVNYYAVNSKGERSVTRVLKIIVK